MQSRVKFSTISRSNAGSFREMQCKVSDERIFEQQVKEMHAVEDRLRQLRLEYDKVCRERGKAHQSAILVRLQEQEIAEFEKRRNEIVQKRAERVARKEAIVYQQRLADRGRKKQDQLEKRKAVFQTNWSPPTDPLTWTDKRSFARELEDLISLEKTIEQKVREKMLQQKRKQATVTATTSRKVQKCCHARNSPSSSSCSCSGSSTPTSEVGSVICVEEIAERVYSKLESLKRRNGEKRSQAQSRVRLPAPVQQKTTGTDDADSGRRRRGTSLKETGVNTSQPVNNGPANDPSLILCSSPSTSYRSAPDAAKNRFQELIQRLNDLSAIESPNEEENVSSFSSEQTLTKDPVTRPKRVASADQEERSAGRLDGDLSWGSRDSSLPKFPSFDRSFFWKDVFNSAGVSMSETIARVLRDAKRTSESIEKSLSLLSISEAAAVAAGSGSPEKQKSDAVAVEDDAAAADALPHHSTPIASAVSSPVKRRSS